jgi:predicted ribosome quality control (RQC) complex YloA/Tae2 family protein
MKLVNYNAITYKVGQSAEENWSLVQHADKSHYWVHLDGKPSCHVIIEMDMPIEAELQYAGQLCLAQTYKDKPAPAKCVFVSTPVRNLKLGSKPGEVLFRKEDQVTYFVG